MKPLTYQGHKILFLYVDEELLSLFMHTIPARLAPNLSIRDNLKRLVRT